MLLAASWRRPVSSLMVAGGLARMKQRPNRFVPAIQAIAMPKFSGGYAKSRKKKKAAEAVGDTSSLKPGKTKTGGLLEQIFRVPWSRLQRLPPRKVEQEKVHTHQNKRNESSDPILSAEQEALVSLAVEGHNIFFTGSAGCGKSTVTKAIRGRLREEGKVVHTLAPTGMVAVANGGMTTWSFAAWTPNTHKRCLDALRKTTKGRFLSKRLRSADVIILDEISMMESMHFERLNQLMKAAWPSDHERSRLPFGGTQIIVTGDFCQLPPVKPFRHCYNCGSDLKRNRDDDTYTCPRHGCGTLYRDEDKWAFRSRAWEECNSRHVYLKTIFRQKSPEFQRLLETLRLGLPLSDHQFELLASCDKPTASHAVKLFPTRQEVRKVNDEEFRRLDTPEQTYKCADVFLWNAKQHPDLRYMGFRETDGSLKALKNHRFEIELKLKEGMQVLLLHNINILAGLCNGAQGVIIGFEPFGLNTHTVSVYREKLPVYWPNYDVDQVKSREFMAKCKDAEGWPIVKFHNGIVRTIRPVCQAMIYGNYPPHTLLGRMQIPLAPAWALTIHKSQGMTLDSVIVKLERYFEVGQIYVALSRVRRLEDLKLEGDLSPLRLSRGDPVVLGWLEEKFGQDILLGA